MGIGPAEPGNTQQAVNGVILLAPVALALALTRPKFASWLLRRAQTQQTRAGRVFGSVWAQGTAKAASADLAEMVSRLNDERVPFTFRTNEGEEIPFDPSTDAPSAKGGKPNLVPQSKMRPPP